MTSLGMTTNGLIGMVVAAIGVFGLVFMCFSETQEKVDKALRRQKM